MGKAKSIGNMILRSNEKINDAFGGAFRGFYDAFMTSRQKFVNPVTGDVENVYSKMGSLKAGFRAKEGDWDNIGGYSGRKIAGGYMMASGAGRIATGGGLYKDNNGNTDIIGIPLI